MAISVQEINDQVFQETAFHNYKQYDVDLFLDHVADEVQALLNTNADLAERVRQYEGRLNDIETLQSQLNEKLQSSQAAYEQVVNAAKEKAEEIVNEAEERMKKAEERMRKAEEAQSKAEEAQSKAEEAQSKAEEAQSRAEEARRAAPAPAAPVQEMSAPQMQSAPQAASSQDDIKAMLAALMAKLN